MDTALGFLIIIFCLIIYVIPALIAIIKKKRNTVAILAFNILLGWTFLGWVIAFVWSLTNDENKEISR